MFNTIKSKIIIIVTGLLIALWFLFAGFAYLYYRDTKTIMLDFASKNIGISAQEINKEVVKLEKNAKDLAMLGELYYKFEKNKTVAEKTVIQLFKNYPETLGGGIWFKEYSVHPTKRLDAIYAFRNKNNQLIIDPNFETEDYNYPEQDWFKEILSNITLEKNIEWSFPYYEKEGSDSLMITAGSGMYDDENKLIGISTVDWGISSVIKKISEIKPTKHSFALFANPVKDYVIVTTDYFLNDKALAGKSIENIPWYNENLKNLTYITYHNKKFIPYVKNLDNGMVLIVCIPKWELFQNIFISVSVLCLILGFLGFTVAALIYAGLKRNILTPIDKLINIANKISKGDNNIEIKIEKPEEFAKLASTYDKMTKDIQDITKERAKISSELQIAKSIQMSSLPDIFPPFPERKEFDIYATMLTAKEVGGDFYDFYFIDETHFMFLIADVSGKGIPAALFMMNAKTLINNISQTIKEPKELITEINKRLCAHNKNGLFITLFAGIIDITTGETYFINCSHNPPLIKQDNEYKYLDIESNIVLGVIDYAEFNIYKTTLNKGDIICTYTDGVTEAFNINDEMFGEERLHNCINSKVSDDVKEITDNIKMTVEKFTENTTQSDDITMLVFKYNGVENSQNIEKFADIANAQNYKKFYTWLHQICEKWSLDEELTNKLDMCAEEIYANIQFYAYGDTEGIIETEIYKDENIISVTFKDKGKAYNPLEKPDPDINLPPEERTPGGLGIYMVKQMTKDIKYARINNENILTLIF